MWNPFKRKIHLRSNQRGIGGRGENDAIDYLVKRGYKVTELNWYNAGAKRLGEIDIIAWKDDEVAFIEVKSRKASSQSTVTLPEEQITQSKIGKIDRVAQKYIAQNDLWETPWHIDAITVIYDKNGENPKITHLKNIFY